MKPVGVVILIASCLFTGSIAGYALGWSVRANQTAEAVNLSDEDRKQLSVSKMMKKWTDDDKALIQEAIAGQSETRKQLRELTQRWKVSDAEALRLLIELAAKNQPIPTDLP